MKNKKIILSIIKEARIDENRTPLVPSQISNLLDKLSNLKIIVQPSKNRCFKDEDYSKAGAQIEEDISQSDIIFGIKEVEISKLIENKTYLFFSHTSKIRNDNSQSTQDAAIIYKKKLLREILKKKITLIDYENIRDKSKNAYRYLGFGRFAGIVGCYNTLILYLKLQKKQLLPRAFEINSYKKIQELISRQNFNKLKILQTGKGNVAKGSMEILRQANIKQISLNDYLNKKYDEAVFCNISLRDHVERNDGKDSSYQDFMLNPQEYKSKATNYLRSTDMLITGHYWDPKFPKLFSPNQINEFKNLKIIGDITCDINGSIPTTIRSTSITKPYYSIDINSIKDKSILIGQFDSPSTKEIINKLMKKGVKIFSLNLLPRITRAQSMDVLSSQANLAGYRAVIESVEEFGKAVPMMMTAAGTITPAKVLVIGAGVAGLQAIATAKRLGAIVSATDVRTVAKEQVESLGGKFLAVEGAENLETSGGYAKEAGEDFKKKQTELLKNLVKKNDIIICTALIPGKKAPRIISEEMVKSMKPGSIIYDLAVSQGGNSAFSEADKVNVSNGVKVMGARNILNNLALSASYLYAKNLSSFVNNLYSKEKKDIYINREDEIITQTLIEKEL